MAEATLSAHEPRYWKITVNPAECPKGAWELYRSTGLAMLGLPGEQGEASPAVLGKWLDAVIDADGYPAFRTVLQR